MMKTVYRQRGLSMWELLFFAVLIGVTAMVLIKLFPLYMEKFKVVKAMESVASQTDVRNLDDAQIKDRLLRHFEIEDVDRFERQEDLKKVFKVAKNKDNAGRTMSFVYEIRAPFVYDLDVIVKVNSQIAIAAYNPQ